MKRGLVPGRCVLSWLIVVGLESACVAQPATFQAIGHLFPNYATLVEALSADGRVITGWTWNTVNDNDVPFRWTAETGFQNLEPEPHGERDWYPTAISADGSVIVGYSSAFQTPERAFRWTAATGTVDMGTLPGHISAIPFGVSGDGKTIVGASSGALTQAFIWTEAGGMQPFLPGTWSNATDISLDGSVIVGRIGNSLTLWTASTGTQALAVNGHYSGAVSTDGGVIVGRESNVAGGAFRWSDHGGMQYLPFIPGAVDGDALAVSGDGSTVVGKALVWPPVTVDFAAWIWDESRGSRPLIDALRDEHGLDLQGWDLWRANAISADGRIIVGLGLSPCWQTQAFVANLGTGPACDADCNADGALTVADFSCFHARFIAKDLRADCTRNCKWTVADFGCFQTKFVAGCP